MSGEFGCNESPLTYWRQTGYARADVDAVCSELNEDWMLARLNFSGSGEVEVAISDKTWKRQEGHYPTIAKFFGEVGRQAACLNKTGSMIVWLEDGLWEPHVRQSFRAPILSFGRHSSDRQSFLIPDPAFLGSCGYGDELNEIRSWNSEMPFSQKKMPVFWRGAATGLNIENELWKTTARGRLVLLAKEIGDPAILDAKITKIDHLPPEQQKVMADHGVLGEMCPFREFLNYRHVVDADGYCCAWKSLFLKLASNSLVLKIDSDYEQWYFYELEPWRHYIPLHSGLKNFHSVHTWLLANSKAAEQIVAQAHQLIESITYQRALNEVSEMCAQILATQR